jgi:hypothetical protein
MFCKKSLIVIVRILIFLGSFQPVFAQDQQLSDSQITNLLNVKIRTVETLAFHPKLIDATNKQNAQNLSIETIRQRDEEWGNTEELTPFKRSLQISEAGKVLQRIVEDNISFNEAFLTDNQGANVAAYPATSDYWQGDEEKWLASFNNGNGKIFVGPIERDESTQSVAIQISAPVIGASGTIGVLIVGVSLSYLEAKQQ